jgi:hypothetical protein
LVSELGTDISKWPTSKHFSSWLGLCPNWKKTGGKVKSSHPRKGKNRAATALRLAAWSLLRSHSSLGAYLRRQRARRGAPKALTATAHKLARILYNLLRYGVAYRKPEEAAFAEHVRQRQEKQLHRRAKELGYALTKLAAAEGPADPPPAEGPSTGVVGRPSLVAPESPVGEVRHDVSPARQSRCAQRTGTTPSVLAGRQRKFLGRPRLLTTARTHPPCCGRRG